MANLSMDAETRKELLRNYANASNDIRFIKNGYKSQLPSMFNTGTEVAYLVSFVHPEVADIYTELSNGTYTAGRPTGFPADRSPETVKKIPGITFDTLRSEYIPSEIPINPDAHPMCRMLDNLYGGILLHVTEGGRKGETDTAFSNRMVNNQLSDIYRKLNDNRYTTIGFLNYMSTKLNKITSSGRATNSQKAIAKAKLDMIERIKDSIDFDSLFGYKYPQDAEQEAQLKTDGQIKLVNAEQWAQLKMREHIFYASIMLKSSDDENDADANLNVANSVFAMTVKLADLIQNGANGSVQKMLRTLDSVLSSTIQEQANDNAVGGELNKHYSIGQLAALMVIAPGMPCGAEREPLVGDTNDNSYAMKVLRESGANEDDLAEYASAMDAIRAFRGASAGEGRIYKSGITNWSLSKIGDVVGKNASGEYNSDGESVERSSKLYTELLAPLSKQVGSYLSDSVNKLLANLTSKEKTGNYYHPLRMAALVGTLIDNMHPGEFSASLVAGLTPDASEATAGVTSDDDLMHIADDVGTKPSKVEAPSSETIAKANDVSTPAQSAGSYAQRLIDRDSLNPLKWSGQEMATLNSDEDDVTNALVAPECVIPLFCTRMVFPGSDVSQFETAMWKDAIALATYAVIFVTDVGSTNARIQKIDGIEAARPTETVEDDEQAVNALTLQSISPKIKIDDVIAAVEEYLYTLASGSSSVANAIELRNRWLETLETGEWYNIARIVLDTVRNRNVPGRKDELESFDATYTEAWMNKIRAYILRYVFEVKQQSLNVELDSSLTMDDAQPLYVINKSERGRLRLTGGAEDSITKAGKEVLKYMHGTVLKALHSNDGDNTYRIRFESGQLSATYDVQESAADTWVFPRAVYMDDPGDSTKCYAVWRGIRFIASKSIESGPSNTYRKSDDYYGASNEVHLTDNSGSVQGKMFTPSMDKFTWAMGTASAKTISLIQEMSDAVEHSGIDVNEFGTIADALTFFNMERSGVNKLTRGQVADEIPEGLWENLKLYNLLNGNLQEGATTAVNELTDALMANIKHYSSNKDFNIGLDNVRNLESVLKWVEHGPDGANFVRLMRLIKAFGTEAEATNHLYGVDYPFVIVPAAELSSQEDNEYCIRNEDGSFAVDENGEKQRDAYAITVNNTELDADHVFHPLANTGETFDYYEGMDAVRTAMREIATRFEEIAGNPENADTGTRHELYVKSIKAIKDLIRVHLDHIKGAIPREAKTNQKADVAAYNVLLQYLDNVALSPDAVHSMEQLLEIIEPYAKRNPVIMQRSLGDIIIAMQAAKDVPDELNMSRHQETDYNKGYGHSDPRRVTGHEDDELLGREGEENAIDQLVSPESYMGTDDETAEATDSIDESALLRMSNNNANDFEDATDCTMMSYILFGDDAYHTGSGRLRLNDRISQTDFKKLAAALDSAHADAKELNDDVPSGNAAITAYAQNTDAHTIITKIIDAFYVFMTSKRDIYRRNIVAEADAIKEAIDSRVAKANNYIVADVVNEVRDSFDNLVNGLSNREDVNNGDPEVIYEVAHQLSTAAANIILKLEAYQRTETVSGEVNGLGKFNDFSSRPGERTNKYAAVGMLPGVVTGGSSRINTEKTSDLRHSVFGSHIRDLRQEEDYSDTLAGIYNALGMSDTMGYRGALIPFDDILSKLDNKANKETRAIYNGVVNNDLASAFVYMLMRDESGYSTAYASVGWFLKKLLGQVDEDGQVHSIDFPEYVFSGVTREESDEPSNVTFDKDGRRDTTTKIAKPFANIGEIAQATGGFIGTFGPNQGGEETEITEDIVMSIVRTIRTKVINRMLAHNPVLDDLRKRDSETSRPLFKERISAFEKSIQASAARTCGETGYAPLARLYSCVDYGAIEDAMKATADRSADLLKTRQRTAQSNDIMRRVFGNHYSDAPQIDDNTLDGLAPEKLKSVLSVALGEMCQTGISPSIKKRNALKARDEQGTNLLSLFKGNDTAANDFISMCMDRIPLENAGALTAEEINEIADHIVNQVFAEHAPTENTGVFNEISTAMVSFGNGSVPKATAVKDIGEIIDPNGNMNDVAENILNEYERTLNKYETSGKTVNDAVRKNIANDILDKLYNRESEFSRQYIKKHASSEADDLKAYRTMHGYSPVNDMSYLKTDEGSIGGASELHRKVYNILSNNDADEASLLKDLQFSIDHVNGAGALEKFNDKVNNLKSKLLALYDATVRFVMAKLQGVGNPKLLARAAMYRIGETPRDRDTNTTGIVRRRALEELEAVVSSIKDSLGYKNPNDKSIDLYGAQKSDPETHRISWGNNPIDVAVNNFIDTYCNVENSDDRERLEQWNTLYGKKMSQQAKDEMAKQFVEIRDVLASAFANNSGLYTKGAESLANAASASRGVYTPDVNLSRVQARELIRTFSKVRGFPIKENKNESDVLSDGSDKYIIGDSYATENECIAVLRAALQKYCDETGDLNLSELSADENVAKFIACVNQCISFKPDISMNTDGITALLIGTLHARHMLSLSPIPGCVRIKRMVDIANAGRPKDEIVRQGRKKDACIFDVPASIIHGLVDDALNDTSFTGSANEWESFARELSKYTLKGAKEIDETIGDERLKNQLLKLFMSVNDTRIPTRLNAALGGLSDEEREVLSHAGGTVTTDDGIKITRVNENVANPKFDTGDQNIALNRHNPDAEIGYVNPDEPEAPAEEHPAANPEGGEPPEQEGNPEEDEF